MCHKCCWLCHLRLLSQIQLTLFDTLRRANSMQTFFFSSLFTRNGTDLVGQRNRRWCKDNTLLCSLNVWNQKKQQSLDGELKWPAASGNHADASKNMVSKCHRRTIHDLLLQMSAIVCAVVHETRKQFYFCFCDGEQPATIDNTDKEWRGGKVLKLETDLHIPGQLISQDYSSPQIWSNQYDTKPDKCTSETNPLLSWAHTGKWFELNKDLSHLHWLEGFSFFSRLRGSFCFMEKMFPCTQLNGIKTNNNNAAEKE